MPRPTLRTLQLAAAIAALTAGQALAQRAAEPSRPAAPARRPMHTFSIVAVDSATGQIGVAVQSHWFSVGGSVIWAEPGVGAVATQSFIEPAYGPRGLALMRTGVPAPLALRALLAADPDSAVRQLGDRSTRGARVASYTGRRDIAAAGSRVGRGYAAQANLMLAEHRLGRDGPGVRDDARRPRRPAARGARRGAARGRRHPRRASPPR